MGPNGFGNNTTDLSPSGNGRADEVTKKTRTLMSDSSQLPPEFIKEQGLYELERSLSLAEVRCLSWPEIRPRLRVIWKDPQAKELILHIQEIDLSESEGKELAEEVKCLSVAAEQLHGRDRYTVDSRLMQAAKALPQTELYKHALDDLNHRRKLRRLGAYNILRRIGLCKEWAPRLVERYRETGDQDLLTLIARSPEAIQSIDADWLLSELEEQYWRMRVIEVVIRNSGQMGSKYASSYPHEFVHAAGRSRATNLAPVIREVFLSHSSDWELLSLSAWALGLFGDREGLAEIRRILDRELATNRRE